MRYFPFEPGDMIVAINSVLVTNEDNRGTADFIRKDESVIVRTVSPIQSRGHSSYFKVTYITSTGAVCSNTWAGTLNDQHQSDIRDMVLKDMFRRIE